MSRSLWPFFTFYGGKWRSAPRYPSPKYSTIIEPFAGAAGYSVRYPQRKVILVERDETIASLWKYLIQVTRSEIESLPLFPVGGHVDELDVCPEARSLIGFWLNKACASPCKTAGAWMRQGLRPKSFWGPEIRYRIAMQVEAIKHWTIIHGDYSSAPDTKATWFIDPPYKLAGKLYRHSSRDIDYLNLARWCRTRLGQAIVCENDGADWLPFAPHITIKSTEGKHGKAKSMEAIWQTT